MRWRGLVCCFLGCCIVATKANSDKTIFTAPEKLHLPTDEPLVIDRLQLARLSPVQSSLRTFLPVAFANAVQPRERESWYLLHDLNPGTRYELRICWPATQSTVWDLKIFSFKETLKVPNFTQNLAKAASSGASWYDTGQARIKSPQSLLFLRITGAADYFTLKKDLMDSPPPVHVEIILDPFLWNIFPKSLLPTAVYIVAIAIVGGLTSRQIWIWLVASLETTKLHED